MTRILADDDKREDYPLYDGLFAYFPAALLEIARWSKVGNDKHNPGEALHWAREKSTDHENKILRHLLDAREEMDGGFVEATALAWRSLALLQTILEERGMASGPNGQWLKDKNEESKSAKGVQEYNDVDVARGALVSAGFKFDRDSRRWYAPSRRTYFTDESIQNVSLPYKFVKDSLDLYLIHTERQGIAVEGTDAIRALPAVPSLEQREVLGFLAKRPPSQSFEMAAQVRDKESSPPGILGN